MCFRCEIKNRLTGSIFLNVNHCHSQHPFHRFVRAYMRDIYTRVREYAAHTGLRCEAYLANDDITACEAIAAFRELGYAVPKDIAIAGFDNSLLAREISPKLTALAQPLEEIGKKAVEVLLAQMHDGVPAQMYELESRVIVRESTIHFVPAQS